MRIENLLRDEIQSELDELKKMPLGSDEYKTSVDGVTKLLDRAIELDRIDIEIQDKEKSREIENNLKLKQMKDDNKDRWIRNIIAAAGIIIPSVLTIWGTTKTLKFEETGTVTTMAGRNFISNLFRRK